MFVRLKLGTVGELPLWYGKVLGLTLGGIAFNSNIS
jgi:hypothetical protein